MKRKASRRKEDIESRLSTFQALINFNPYDLEEQIDRAYKQILKRMLNDFSRAMMEHQMNIEMANYKLQEHYASALKSIEAEIEKLNFWIQSNIINKDYLQKVKEKLEKNKQYKRQRLRSVLTEALKLSESLRELRIAELEKLLRLEMEKHIIHQIKNTYEYDKTRSLQQKYQKEYDDHFQKLEQRYNKYMSKFEERFNQYD